jgi:hypothetical protein
MNLESMPMASREDSHLHSLHVPRFRHYASRIDMHPLKRSGIRLRHSSAHREEVRAASTPGLYRRVEAENELWHQLSHRRRCHRLSRRIMPRRPRARRLCSSLGTPGLGTAIRDVRGSFCGFQDGPRQRRPGSRPRSFLHCCDCRRRCRRLITPESVVMTTSGLADAACLPEIEHGRTDIALRVVRPSRLSSVQTSIGRIGPVWLNYRETRLRVWSGSAKCVTSPRSPPLDKGPGPREESSWKKPGRGAGDKRGDQLAGLRAIR